MTIDTEKKTESNTPSWQPGLQLFLRLSGWIGGPVLVAVFVGRYLDAKYHTDPWLFLFSVGVAFAVSTWAIIFYGLKEMRRIEGEITKHQDTNSKEQSSVTKEQ